MAESLSSSSDSWTEKPAFGTGLDEHLKRSGREIALPLEACVMMLLETGMKEEVRIWGRVREAEDVEIWIDQNLLWISIMVIILFELA